MQGGRDPFFGFGDPFGSFGGSGRQRSLLSSFFGGRDPFDDPFFTRPFGSMFETRFFGSHGGPFQNRHASGSGFLEHQPPLSNISRGPIIEELNSDDEKDETESGKEKQENPRKHGRSSEEPFVEDPEDEVAEKRIKLSSCKNGINQLQHIRSQPQSHSFTFQSSTVSYGGTNGAYYTSSTTRRSGSNGFTFEESKEANSATGRATHRISRGIQEKGHSVTRKLKSNGLVDTMQTLHNLDQDELVGFEDSWKRSARRHLPGWNEQFSIQDVMGSEGARQHRTNRGGWVLPANEGSKDIGGVGASHHRQPSGGSKTDVTSGTGTSRPRTKAKENGGSKYQDNRR